VKVGDNATDLHSCCPHHFQLIRMEADSIAVEFYINILALSITAISDINLLHESHRPRALTKVFPVAGADEITRFKATLHLFDSLITWT
jgi:hypothetical protein